jgi:hypothetical protein
MSFRLRLRSSHDESNESDAPITVPSSADAAAIIAGQWFIVVLVLGELVFIPPALGEIRNGNPGTGNPGTQYWLWKSA